MLETTQESTLERMENEIINLRNVFSNRNVSELYKLKRLKYTYIFAPFIVFIIFLMVISCKIINTNDDAKTINYSNTSETRTKKSDSSIQTSIK